MHLFQLLLENAVKLYKVCNDNLHNFSIKSHISLVFYQLADVGCWFISDIYIECIRLLSRITITFSRSFTTLHKAFKVVKPLQQATEILENTWFVTDQYIYLLNMKYFSHSFSPYLCGSGSLSMSFQASCFECIHLNLSYRNYNTPLKRQSALAFCVCSRSISLSIDGKHTLHD